LEGHALEQALTEQVEEGAAGGVHDEFAQSSARLSSFDLDKAGCPAAQYFTYDVKAAARDAWRLLLPCKIARGKDHADQRRMRRAAGARETLAVQPVPVKKRRKKRAAVQQVLPAVEAPRPLLSEGVRVGLFGVGALAALALAYLAARKLLSAQLPKVQKVGAAGPLSYDPRARSSAKRRV
jgi:hypothetical protein